MNFSELYLSDHRIIQTEPSDFDPSEHQVSISSLRLTIKVTIRVVGCSSSRHWSSESGSGASEAAEAAEAQSTTDDDIQIVDELFYVGSSDDDDDDGDVEGRGRNWSSDHEHETESDENEENVPTDTSIVTVIESDRSNPPPAPQEQPGNATPGPSPTGPVPASGSGSPQLTHEPEPPQDEPNNNVAARTQRIVGDPQEDDSGSESDSDISDLTVDTVVALVHQDQPNEDEPTEP